MSKSDPYDVIRLFPDLIPQESRSSQDQERLPKLQDRELENGLLALIEFLTEVSPWFSAVLVPSPWLSAVLVLSPWFSAVFVPSPWFSAVLVLSPWFSAVLVPSPWFSAVFVPSPWFSAVLVPSPWFNAVRHNLMGDPKNKNSIKPVNLNHKSIEQLLSIIDTTLLKCYLQTNDALVAPLLRLNHCHLEETEKTLRRHHKYSELIILYQTKGLHLKALELLEKQADQPESSLRGFHRTIQYLQHLGKEHMDLILKFAGWVLEQNPEEGLKIFTEDIQEVEHLPRPRILDYLLRQHKLLVIPYLVTLVRCLTSVTW
uniref:Vacuolar sorting protein 39/Transforming growth factor beta receptor-associated domain-containing protein n=1 Tax=Timema genevievae TaxID=629358 RepID=A0A7R9PT42_TIMGE|nr:unnamed protein product [Timema genevievae]